MNPRLRAVLVDDARRVIARNERDAARLAGAQLNDGTPQLVGRSIPVAEYLKRSLGRRRRLQRPKHPL